MELSEKVLAVKYVDDVKALSGDLEDFSEPVKTLRKSAKQDADRSKTVRVSLACPRGRWAAAAFGARYFVKEW